MEPDFQKLDLLLNFGLPIFLLLVTYVTGSALEARHFRDIKRREEAMHGFPVVSFRNLPETCSAASSTLVTGSIVISLDYFKRVIAGLRGLVGGRITTYEPLLDRARREAILRMVESARQQGYDAIVNVRLETSRLANAARDGKSTAGVEMLAFGTAVKFSGRSR